MTVLIFLNFAQLILLPDFFLTDSPDFPYSYVA